MKLDEIRRPKPKNMLGRFRCQNCLFMAKSDKERYKNCPECGHPSEVER